MRELANRLAPGLTGRLSERAERLVAERAASGELSPFACHDASAIRRDPCDRDRDTFLRTAFVRDAEKIVHLPAYNRLAGKTQVFSFRANDDISRRGLHVQLVARVARDIGRALGLNLDLIEAIALGHDLGHTPFGHAGERFLNDVFHARTGRWFFHNVQSVRVLDALAGRNVSLQTLDGALCHNGEFEQQAFDTSGLAEFDTFERVVDSCWRNGGDAISHLRPMTLEGCVVRVSDIIAYVGKDRQDAICAGLCDESTFDDGLGGAYNAWALSAFVADIVEYSVGRDRIEMSEEAFAEMRRAKRENYEKTRTTRRSMERARLTGTSPPRSPGSLGRSTSTSSTRSRRVTSPRPSLLTTCAPSSAGSPSTGASTTGRAIPTRPSWTSSRP